MGLSEEHWGQKRARAKAPRQCLPRGWESVLEEQSTAQAETRTGRPSGPSGLQEGSGSYSE